MRSKGLRSGREASNERLVKKPDPTQPFLLQNPSSSFFRNKGQSCPSLRVVQVHHKWNYSKGSGGITYNLKIRPNKTSCEHGAGLLSLESFFLPDDVFSFGRESREPQP
jgi:hypothetical protein